LPDVARAGVELLEARARLAPFDVFNFEGYSVDSSVMIDALRDVLGDPNRRTWAFPWWLVRAASPFSRALRLALEVRYLWDEPVVLDGKKLRRTLPEFETTPLGEALAATLAAWSDARDTSGSRDRGPASEQSGRGAREPRADTKQDRAIASGAL
jgi:hypothetical protein